MYMKTIMTVALSLGASTALAQPDKGVSVTRTGTHPSIAGPSSNFTGAVRFDSRFSATAPATVGGGTVTFETGARTACMSIPLAKRWSSRGDWLGPSLGRRSPGKSVLAISPGCRRVLSTGTERPPGSGMSHIAISEALDGKSVEWMEHVTDEQYAR